ncbi:hypothetical protein [Nonomuraea deserti]|uniref:hypothetical protein n=1 Tax=Nonomuraea deserti TaxID=1848322 RepID=UPI0014055D74|nr:hypothetical protein [Nonomuraea deserti]
MAKDFFKAASLAGMGQEQQQVHVRPTGEWIAEASAAVGIFATFHEYAMLMDREPA